MRLLAHYGGMGLPKPRPATHGLPSNRHPGILNLCPYTDAPWSKQSCAGPPLLQISGTWKCALAPAGNVQHQARGKGSMASQHEGLHMSKRSMQALFHFSITLPQRSRAVTVVPTWAKAPETALRCLETMPRVRLSSL